VTYCLGTRGIEYREEDGVRRWYIYDGLGSVVAEVDDGSTSQDGSVQVTATRSYDVYGAVRSTNPDPDAGGNHKFCGQLGHTADADTGLTYMRARYYDPTIGRFISEDPGRNGANWYAYCNSSPTNLVDVDGRMPGATLSAYVCLFAAVIMVLMGLLEAMEEFCGDENFKCTPYIPTNRRQRRGSEEIDPEVKALGKLGDDLAGIRRNVQTTVDKYADIAEVCTDLAMK
jgi:RHS repeat-associated protein